MLESFKQQQQMSALELYIEKDVVGGSMFHYANSLTSCGNYLSNDETQPPTNMSNLHLDEDDDDDDDYLVSNSYVEESLNEDDSVGGISDTNNEVTDMIPPVRIVRPTEGVQGIQNPFWNDALHYNNINWSHLDEEDICGLEMPSSFNVGQELYVGMDFDSKDAVKNVVKQYVMKVHQSFKVVERKWDKYVVCCLNKNANFPCPFYMKTILSKKIDSWKVTQWGGPHTCLNMTMTQDHEKLDSDLIATCVPTLLASTFFYQNLEKFRQLSPAIATWIDRISKEKWTMTYDREGRRYGHMTTNLSECINKALKDCRNIPITALVQSTYSRCRKYFVERGRQAQRQLNEGKVYPLHKVLPLGHHVTAKVSWSTMKNEDVFPQHHQTNVRLQTYQCHDLRKDIDTSAKDTEKMLVACNTFHGHVAPFVGKNLSLEQSPFVCQNLEFQHLTEACETFVGKIDALMLDHMPQAQ
ncbi:hypothetical protein GmHk_15G044229 [Glycine max]|nr:hypothetical protein GmHk_15G044229 [Glycine max]